MPRQKMRSSLQKKGGVLAPPTHCRAPTSMASAPAFLCRSSLPISKRRSFFSPAPAMIARHRIAVVADLCYLRIFDTTLRDGERSPGVSLSVNEKLDIARQLTLLGVDAIEVGYPFASPSELQAAKLIAREVGNPSPNPEQGEEDAHVPSIYAFARCKKGDIDAAWEGVKHAAKPGILTFIATSDIHLEHKLCMSREDAIRVAVEMVSYIKSLGCNDIYFGAEDAGRTDPRMLCCVVEEVVKAGATTIGVGDTVGMLLPHEISRMISNIKANIPGGRDVIILAHCHNDLGLATANALAAAAAGAKQLDVTINGIGERAGNASLEESYKKLGNFSNEMRIHCKSTLEDYSS